MATQIVSKVKNLKGEIIIPADKSVSHRAIMISSLAKGKSRITNFSSGADCWSTLNLFKNLGVEINVIDNKTIEVLSRAKFLKPNLPLDAGNSGTTMRLVSGILAGQDFNSILVGDESLSKRPMKRVIEPLSLMGAKINSLEGRAPLKITGTRLHGINYTSELSSAQVKSCILLAGVNKSTFGKTTYIEPNKSRNHTELMLKYLGADIEIDGNKTTVSPSELTAKNIEIIGDISSAAFFIVAGLIVEGSDFIIRNVGINNTRTGILDIVQRMGGGIELLNQREIAGELIADIRVCYNDSLKSCKISGADIPKLIDELPVIAVLASQAKGETIVNDAGDLRNKEADRIACLVKELRKIGVDIEELNDGFIVRGKTSLKGGSALDAYHDHRLAMSFYMAGLVCENEIAINGFKWINISFPEFGYLVEELKS